MTPAAPPTSARLLRAAEAERADLERHRARLVAVREDLRAELSRIEAGLTEVDERRRLLDRLAPADAASETHEREERAADTRTVSAAPEAAAGQLLRGPAIREAAVRVMSARPDAEALHYREWYELLVSDGFAVVGKDPLAVFLTQLNRSPVVRKSTQAGVYELDRSATARLRAQLDQLHQEFRELAARPASPAGLSAVRARRDELNSEIGQVEKGLEEASRLLEAPAAAAPVEQFAAAG
jgi:hypothetical protein